MDCSTLRNRANSEGNNTNSSALCHDRANTGSRINSVLVRRDKATLLRNLRRAVRKDVVFLNGETFFVRVKVGNNSLVDIGEGVGFNEYLRTHAGVDTRNTAFVAGAVDVACAEAD
jgi:hypothetical protein